MRRIELGELRSTGLDVGSKRITKELRIVLKVTAPDWCAEVLTQFRTMRAKHFLVALHCAPADDSWESHAKLLFVEL